jgi:hypothetical protein
LILEVGQMWQLTAELIPLTVTAILCKPITTLADSFLAAMDVDGRFFVITAQAFKLMIVEGKATTPTNIGFLSEDKFAETVFDGCNFLCGLDQKQLMSGAEQCAGRLEPLPFKGHFQSQESARKKLKMEEEAAAATPASPAQNDAVASAVMAMLMPMVQAAIASSSKK